MNKIASEIYVGPEQHVTWWSLDSILNGHWKPAQAHIQKERERTSKQPGRPGLAKRRNEQLSPGLQYGDRNPAP